MAGVPQSIYIGFDARESAAFAVCRHSIARRCTYPIPVYGLILEDVRREGLYQRQTENRGSQLWDTISDAPMSTEFAVSRFLTPMLARRSMREGERAGWALFMDCDILVRDNIGRLFEQADERYAVMFVKHVHEPPPGLKMDDQIQTRYARKNWSSVMMFNVDHSANRALTVDHINGVPGRDLHRFDWIADDNLIGALDVKWNWLAGHSDPAIDPACVHFTDGLPFMPGYENVPYADEWRRELEHWARGCAR
jgi:hypothetical protein